jgi:hypothetical protein
LTDIGPDGPDQPSAHLLVSIAAAFPQYRIWTATAFGHRQFVAQAVSLSTNPHTLVTGNLQELADELTSARHSEYAILDP